MTRLDLKTSSVVCVHLARSPVRLSITIKRALNLADNTLLLLLWCGSCSSVDWGSGGASWSSDRSSAGSNARVVNGAAWGVERRWVAPVLLSRAVELLHDGGHGGLLGCEAWALSGGRLAWGGDGVSAGGWLGGHVWSWVDVVNHFECLRVIGLGLMFDMIV